MPDRMRLCFAQGRTGALAGMILLSIGSSGCLFQSKPHRVFSPPPVQAKPVLIPQTPILEALVIEITGQQSEEAPDLQNWPLPQLPGPPKPPPVRARAPQPPKPEGPQPGPPQPPPKIVQILPVEQAREYNKQFDESVERARHSLELLGKKNVPAGDQTEIERIRNFLLQAEQTHTSDLVTAARLARAADLLAKDLLDRLP